VSVTFVGDLLAANLFPMKNFDTLTEALTDLKIRGYSNDFNIQPDAIECITLNLKLRPEDFHVDEIYRFEGMTDPDDNTILFAVSSSTGVKGVIVDAYGAYADSLTSEMLQRLKIDSKTQH
jgi:hypothetical protein